MSVRAPHFRNWVGAFIALLSFASILVEARAAAVPPPPDRAAVKRMFDPWKTPVPARKLIANIYYVGASGVSSFLITTPAGHILIDTGFEDTVPLIARGVRDLGFKVEDIKFILSSHAHIDHVGGHAAMQKLTGAKIIASVADAALLASGGRDDFLTWPVEDLIYAPARADRIVGEGETLTLGGTTLTAHLTPGHTKGATTWTLTLTDADARLWQVVFYSSASVNAGTPLLNNSRYPEIATDLTASFAKWKALPCDVYFAPHGGAFAMAQKFARLEREPDGPNPFIDPEGYKREIASRERAFLAQLAAEKAEVQK